MDKVFGFTINIEKYVVVINIIANLSPQEVGLLVYL